jgi:hypothetical protein
MARMRQTDDEYRSRLEELLDGHTVDRSEFAYDFDAHHLSVIADGPDSEGAVSRLAADLGRDLLWLERREEKNSAWWGGGGEFSEEDLAAISASTLGREGRLAVGEPAHGLAGWRLTLCQARAAFAFAGSRPRSFVRYREVALLAAVTRDDELSAFLRQSFLEPLLNPGPGTHDLASALRAYLDAGGDLSSTAVALGVPRQTVADQLTGIEDRIGRSPLCCLAELDLALRFHEITRTEAATPDANTFRRSRPDSARPR